MSQDTTLPPLPEWSLRDDLGGLVPSDIRSALKAYARAAIAAQAPQHSTLVITAGGNNKIVCHGTATDMATLELIMQECAQEPAVVKESLTTEQAQQAQGVPAPAVLSVPENCKNRLFDPTVGDACVFDAGGGWPYQVEEAKKKLTLEAEYKVTKVEAHSSHTRIWIEGHDDWFNNMLFRVPAAAPQAEPQPEREPRAQDYPGETIDPQDTKRLAGMFEGRTVAGVLASIGVVPGTNGGE